MIRVFPVALEGHPTYTDDFGLARPGGTKHQGNDIFADEGTPIVAVDDGAVRFVEDPVGGHAFYLTAARDRTVYYGAHLSAYEGEAPRLAVAGEILGYVGKTGNAARTSPHLHFEVHPSGGVAVDPFQLLAGLEPPSVVSSLGAMDQVLPPGPAGDLPPLPVVVGPVPPIPTRRGRGGVVFAFGLALSAAVLAARRRHAIA